MGDPASRNIWKWIQGYRGLYKVSNEGKIWSEQFEKMMIPQLNNRGYYVINLHKNSEIKPYLLHYLVAREFVPNPRHFTVVDHIDNDVKNNSSSNLRWSTKTQNQQNRRKFRGTKSPYKGVCYRDGKFIAHIIVNKKMIHLGTFKTESEAADSYNEAAKHYFGAYAKLNKIPPRIKW